MAIDTTGRTVVRFASHRARDRAKRITTEMEAVYAWGQETGTGGWYLVADEVLDQVLAITGATRARVKGELHRCWTSRDTGAEGPQPREHEVPCQVCRQPTWNVSARCDAHGGG